MTKKMEVKPISRCTQSFGLFILICTDALDNYRKIKMKNKEFDIRKPQCARHIKKRFSFTYMKYGVFDFKFKSAIAIFESISFPYTVDG